MDDLPHDYPDAYRDGSTVFFGLPFRITPAVLVPRLETECLVRRALAVARALAADTVVEIWTGSGVIVCSIARSLGADVRYHAGDIDPAALAVARANAASLGVRCDFVLSDLLASEDLPAAVRTARSCLFVANLPYVPEADRERMSADTRHEPPHALFSGVDGFEHYERFFAEVARLVRELPDRSFGLVAEMDPSHVDRALAALAPLGGAGEAFADYAGDIRFIDWRKTA